MTTDSLAHPVVLHEAGSLSRRGFVTGAAVALTGGVLWAIGQRVGVTGHLQWVSALALTRSTFANLLGQTFQIRSVPSGELAAQLVEVRDLPSARFRGSPAAASAESENRFSILFRGPADTPLGQGTYEFSHTQLGAFSLFIVPMASDMDTRDYEAVFNRL
jgi:hypothetical protein